MTDTVQETVVAPPAPTGDPAMIGLPSFIVGATAFALGAVGYIPAAGSGGVLPNIITATGIGLLVAAVWATRLGQSAVASLFAIFAGFWLSYAALLLGLDHNWYAIPAADVKQTIVTYLVAWAVLIGVLTLSTLRLPMVFSAILALVEIALLFILAGTIQGSNTLTHIGGYIVFAFCALGLYAFASAAMISTGGKGLSLGNPIVK
ncbi:MULTISPECIES: GPR1/FUN34/YaaH family transporter [Acidithrix]|uniref:Gpr1/Fun34/YaaH family protein n=1 Tax=Acidithrix ferrooxidans TaxID=1280514 RepID=A0A0D8HLD8_9ACTN|nr:MULTISPECIES: GPR1/FUN34/YaaH family transporter [Acidithrix]KJF18669.1 Gpr1/Fun34/YaaH family protein [Acidithrix ferrooxidans]